MNFKIYSVMSIKNCILAMPLLLFGFYSQGQVQGGGASGIDTLIAGQPRAFFKLVSGTVLDAVTGKPLESVRITYGDLYAAITDSAGRFTMKVPTYNATLRVNAERYQTKEVALRGSGSVTVKLNESTNPSYYGDVTTPFTPLPGSHLTQAATFVPTKGSWNNTAETPDAYLQGRVAGLNAIRRSGTANTGANLFLRGLSSLYATNQPLFIVDGVYYDNSGNENSLISGYYNNPLSFIDLKDIDNITVIKDGSSIYGAKGANGVILITTARAQAQATKIDVALYGGINYAPARIPVMNASDYRVYLAELLQSKGLSYSESSALPYMDDNTANASYYRYHNNTDWQDQVFRTSTTKNGYLKITGGDNIARYALSIGFLKSDGTLQNTDLSRYNTRFNADLNLSKKLTATTNLSFTYNDQNLKDLGLKLGTNPIYNALVKSPFLRAYDVNEKGIESPTLAGWDDFRISNPAALVQSTKAANKNYRFVGSVNFTYQFTNNLSLGNTVAVTVNKVRESFFVPQAGILSDTLSNAIANNRSGVEVMRNFSFFNDLRLAYAKTFNQVHNFAARAGMRYVSSRSEQDYGLGFNSATDQFTGVGYGVNTLRQIGGQQGDWAWVNTYLNADYNLAGKYFLSLNVAADASSRFGTNSYRSGSPALHLGESIYALYPSLSGAWLVSSENFMKSARFVDLLKVRASYGLTGNDDIGNYTARKYYTPQNLLGVSGLVLGNEGNEALQGESVRKLNAGLDLALLDERVNITLDGYKNKTSNMIVYQPAPIASGRDYIISNSGAMETSGWEASVNVRVLNGQKLKWDLGFNIAHYNSKVTELPVSSILTSYADGTMITKTGSAPNVFYGYRTNGVYTSDAEAAATGLVKRNADGTTTPFKGGDVRFINTTGNDNVIDEDDRRVIGDPNPDYFGGITTGLSYKNLSLDLLFTYSQGGDVYNYARCQLESMTGYQNGTEAVINRWKTAGQVTDVPKATWGDPMGNSRFSDRWIEDGSYLRLRTASLTYKVPLKAGFVKYASVYLTGTNLLTFTKYLGYDPEFSATNSIYGQGVDVMLQPQSRSVQAGIRLGL